MTEPIKCRACGRCIDFGESGKTTCDECMAGIPSLRDELAKRDKCAACTVSLTNEQVRPPGVPFCPGCLDGIEWAAKMARRENMADLAIEKLEEERTDRNITKAFGSKPESEQPKMCPWCGMVWGSCHLCRPLPSTVKPESEKTLIPGMGHGEYKIPHDPNVTAVLTADPRRPNDAELQMRRGWTNLAKPCGRCGHLTHDLLDGRHQCVFRCHPAPAKPEPDKEPEDYKALYHELIMAVARTFPDETRHQTALRYIQRAETTTSGEACQTKKG